MRSLSVVAAAAVAALGSLAAVAEAEHVVKLGDSDFDDHVKQHKFVLAEFYAPWCGHCKSLAPEYEKAAEHFSSETVEGGLSLVAIDATEHKELASRFGVQGFPTLKWIVDGEEADYNGGRTKDDIVSWISKKTGPPAEQVSDAAALDAFKAKGDVVVVGVFADQEGDAAKAFLSAAAGDDAVLYGISSSADVKAEAGVEGDAGVVVFRNFEAPDEPRVACEGEVTKENVKQCVAGNQLPLVTPFSQSNAQKIFGGAVKQHCLVFVESAEAGADALAVARAVAAEHKGEYLFVSVTKSDDRILEFFGVSAGDLPTARIVVMGETMKKFKIPDGEFSEEALRSFVNAHKSGELSPDLKSEDPSEEDKANPVWILKGKTHDEVALDGSKNTFIKYYAPWCGHCKKMAPDFDKLGEHFKDDEDVVIAKFDATANEVETVSVSGFPTLKFFPKGVTSKEGMMDFDGSRDFDGMKTFIEQNKK